MVWVGRIDISTPLWLFPSIFRGPSPVAFLASLPLYSSVPEKDMDLGKTVYKGGHNNSSLPRPFVMWFSLFSHQEVELISLPFPFNLRWPYDFLSPTDCTTSVRVVTSELLCLQQPCSFCTSPLECCRCVKKPNLDFQTMREHVRESLNQEPKPTISCVRDLTCRTHPQMTTAVCVTQTKPAERPPTGSNTNWWPTVIFYWDIMSNTCNVLIWFIYILQYV